MHKKEFQFPRWQSITSSMPKKKRAGKKSSSKKQSKNPGTPLDRKRSLVNKVAKDINCADPLRQQNLPRKYGVPQTTVAHIISVDFGMKYKEKQKTHKLTDKNRLHNILRVDQHSEDG